MAAASATNITLAGRISAFALPLCIVGMDACWIYGVAWLGRAIVVPEDAASPLPSPALLAGLEVVAWWLAARLLERTRLPDAAINTGLALLGIAVALGLAAATYPLPSDGNWLAMLGSATYGAILCLSLWALGAYRAAHPPEFTDAFKTFRTGLVYLAIGILVVTLLGHGREDVLARLGGVPVWFFAWSLGALALGNRENVRRESGSSAMRSWGPISALTIAVIMLAGIGTGAFGGKDLTSVVQDVVLGLIVLVAGAMYAVLYVVLWLVSLLGIKLEPMSVPVKQAQPRAPIQSLADWLEYIRGQAQQTTSAHDMAVTLKWALVGLVLLAVLIGLVALFSQVLRKERDSKTRRVSEERVKLGGWALLVAQSLAWLDLLLAWFRGRRKEGVASSEDDLSSLRGRPEWSGTLSVRQIYARMQSVAAKQGYPRAPQQTPIEYLSVLSAAMPDLRGELGTITSAYLHARYASSPAPRTAVAAANAAWERAEVVFGQGQQTTNDERQTTNAKG